MSEHRLDKYYYPVEIPTAATIRINATNISLTAGIYYAHASNTFPATYISFYAHLCARLITILGGIWDVDPIRPSGYALSSGIRLKVSGFAALTLDLSSTTPVVRRLLGFAEDDTSTVAFTSGFVEGPFAAFGAWCPWSAFFGRATAKDSGKSRMMTSSSDHAEDAIMTIWRARRIRAITYEMVYGPYVYGRRAGVAELATLAYVAQGDANNALDQLWEAASNTGRETLVVYDMVDLDLDIPATGWETLKLASTKAYGDMEDLATRNNIAPDYWTIRMPWIVTGGFYDL